MLISFPPHTIRSPFHQIIGRAASRLGLPAAGRRSPPRMRSQLPWRKAASRNRLRAVVGIDLASSQKNRYFTEIIFIILIEL
jgi:hypothetical protein